MCVSRGAKASCDCSGDLKIESFENHSTDTRVSIKIKLTEEMMQKAEQLGLEKKFKIKTTL